jgi:REP element-mobilizing transposase RayT
VGRKKRIQYEGAIVHVWARRVDRSPLFRDEEDYARYVSLLAETVARFDWILLTFCLMPNHVHLLVQLRRPNLHWGMHWLHKTYVRRFNDRHDREGRLFEHRFKSKVVEDELYFVTVLQYIEQNPVHAGLCQRPEGWPWSSRGVVANGRAATWLADDVLAAIRRELKDGTWNRL